jgi:phosphomannomutase
MEAVKANGADYGVALDGDADRLQLVDAQGRLFNGDEVLFLMVSERLARGEAVPGAVGTLMTNLAVELALKARGVQFVRAKVGDRYVLEELEKNGWLLGGEGSGHLLALDKHSTGGWIDQRAAGFAGLRSQWSKTLHLARRRELVSSNADQPALASGSQLASQCGLEGGYSSC